MRSLLLSIKGFIETTESPKGKANINLRTNDSLSGTHVTRYTYKSLVGILTATDLSGKTITYDTFNSVKRTYIKEGTTEKN